MSKEVEVKEAIVNGKPIPKFETVEEAVQETVEEVIERPYTLRKLRDDDLYPLLLLLRKIGIKDLKDAFKKAIDRKDDDEKDEESVGIDVVFDFSDFLISKIDTHKDDLYEFYSRLSGVPADKIKEMEFGTLPLMIYDSFSEVKNTAFFKVLSKLL